MAVARTKRVIRREWTRDEVKELKKHSKDKTPVKTDLQNTEAHARCRETKGLCAGDPGGSPHQKEVSSGDASVGWVPGQWDSYATMGTPTSILDARWGVSDGTHFGLTTTAPC